LAQRSSLFGAANAAGTNARLLWTNWGFWVNFKYNFYFWHFPESLWTNLPNSAAELGRGEEWYARILHKMHRAEGGDMHKLGDYKHFGQQDKLQWGIQIPTFFLPRMYGN
jgi:hypothetical protein